MRAVKKKTFELEKCYAVAPLRYQEKDHILVAAEKVNRCLMFDLEGNFEDTVWDGPGGTMSMVQIPGSDGVFLATHKFYSPNDSREAMIVMAEPGKVYACELPENMESCDEDHPLPFQVLKDGLLKNHGYCRQTDDNGDYAVIGAECGVF